MAEIYAMRGPHGVLIPADHESEEIVMQLPPGQGVRLLLQQVRYINTHRRFFKMVTIGFDAWEPPALEFAGLPVVKNFTAFRKELIKAAGFYDPVFDLEGNMRLEAHSIAFANMDEYQFLPVYRGVKEVLLQKVLTRYRDADFERVLHELMRF